MVWSSSSDSVAAASSAPVRSDVITRLRSLLKLATVDVVISAPSAMTETPKVSTR